MSAIANAFANVTRRNSVFVSGIFIGAFAFGIGFDTAMTKFWENHNKGKLWKDIRHKYVQNESDS